MSINLIKHKLLVVVLVLLSFVGQTIASTAVPCHKMNKMDMTQTMMMHHDAMDMATDSDDTASSVMLDCCQQDCNCPIGLSASANISSSLSVETFTISAQKIEQYANLLQSQSLTSLYRPPIF